MLKTQGNRKVMNNVSGLTSGISLKSSAEMPLVWVPEVLLTEIPTQFVKGGFWKMMSA